MAETEFLSENNMNISIGLPENKPEILLTPNIGVIGVGGAGGNAVNNMIESGLEGVSFVVANTDAQVMSQSLTHERIQLGCTLTQGLGAGSNPDVGKAAAEESADKIKEAISGLHMLFIAAGMGGGTGTGASPVIAKIAKDMGILTVAVVTKPFTFEGEERTRIAEEGIQKLTAIVDTAIIVPNQNLFRIASPSMTFIDAFKLADSVLYQGVKSITDLMTSLMSINLDFADLKTVIAQRGKAMMGTGEASGEGRARKAAELAISNPLLDVSIKGAKGVLVNISGNAQLGLMEVAEAIECVRRDINPRASFKMGQSRDDNLGDKIRVSVVATGLFDDEVTEPEKTSSLPYPFETPTEQVISVLPPQDIKITTEPEEEKTEIDIQPIEQIQDEVVPPLSTADTIINLTEMTSIIEENSKTQKEEEIYLPNIANLDDDDFMMEAALLPEKEEISDLELDRIQDNLADPFEPPFSTPKEAEIVPEEKIEEEKPSAIDDMLPDLFGRMSPQAKERKRIDAKEFENIFKQTSEIPFEMPANMDVPAFLRRKND